jgi:hypothetical protein
MATQKSSSMLSPRKGSYPTCMQVWLSLVVTVFLFVGFNMANGNI